MIRQTLIALASCLGSFLIFTSVCSAATISFGAVGAQTVGDTFSLPVYVSAAAGESLNAVSSSVTFSPQLVRVVSLDYSTSLVNVWPAKPTYSNSAGTVSFEGVIYNPGFSGSNGKIVIITFKVLASGTARFAFDAPSILANDGQGTEILTSSSGTTVVLQNASPQPAATPSQAPARQPITTSTATTTQAVAPVSTTTVPQIPAVAEVRPTFVPAESGVVTFSIPLYLFNTLRIILLGLLLAGLAGTATWYMRQRSHRVRQHLLQDLVGTNTSAPDELTDTHKALINEVERLTQIQSERELTAEERHTLVRFTRLAQKTEHMLRRKLR